jgi:hypothetical protein
LGSSPLIWVAKTGILKGIPAAFIEPKQPETSPAFSDIVAGNNPASFGMPRPLIFAPASRTPRIQFSLTVTSPSL